MYAGSIRKVVTVQQNLGVADEGVLLPISCAFIEVPRLVCLSNTASVSYLFSRTSVETPPFVVLR
jgi:hypothetical protein